MNCVSEGDGQISRLMNPAIESELRALSPAERILLVEEIWDRIAAEPESVPVSASHRVELDRRLDSLEKNPDQGRPWDEVRDELRRR
ncbi:addiction module component, TIGR02574 family [Opitutus terrae PB90-1]|uniref:Addiction module component, TIGR02574 family n=2 Tax=Opitutus terrae TaxID=107709 RepID=B1ZY23_OPITP|nr:addiction module component, TIGR02574 family [Opitutus terrae PB90-1]